MKTVHRDDYGFEYKSKKSKNSKVREYRFAPVKEENSFNAEEVSFGKNAVAYRVQSKKYSYNYRDGILTVNKNIAREFSKRYTTATVSYDSLNIKFASLFDFKEFCNMYENEK